MKLKPKEPIVMDIEDSSVDNSLELVKHGSKVHSRGIKEDITSDYIFAKLDETSEEAISELVEQAYFSKRMMQKISLVATEYEWSVSEQIWYKIPLKEWKKVAIKKVKNNLFDSFLAGPNMKVVLKRNKPRNPMLQILSGLPTESPDDDLGKAEDVLALIDKKREENKRKKQGG